MLLTVIGSSARISDSTKVVYRRAQEKQLDFPTLHLELDS